MIQSAPLPQAPATPTPWDARLAGWLVRPLLGTWVRPNHLTFLRLVVGLAGVGFIAAGGYAFVNIGMLLVVLSNFLDHTDGALARMGGLGSHFGHLFDLASDALVTVLLFVALGMALPAGSDFGGYAELCGLVAGIAVAAIFFMRMRIEERAGKAGTKQPQFAGFEIEDVLYLLPLVSLFDVPGPFILAAGLVAPLFALWVLRDWLRVCVRHPAGADSRS
ncbi:MAG: CDP-alcohol phosphatidyltransferase family protein [Nevskiaceae bacterium]|nr:MAG: CDP-alcohol phosphatidyltransferase family protein [Nevskiaceae bacterium]TBR73561.1 MAG: CDP-alcohol phosphatidyltransferase family protein [Nevskiaceae bacterium]